MMRLAEILEPLGGRLQGADRRFEAVSTDTRSLPPGALFVALRGPRHDAHAFLAEAEKAGAVAAMVEAGAPVAPSGLPRVQVADTRLALGRLGALWRARFPGPLIGLTGSNGKTTVKELLAAILGAAGPTHATRGNLNNDIGVPLTLLGLRPGHRHAVIEMGANHAGEIAYLAGLAAPDVALITNAAPAHLEGFGSLEGVVAAKGEILDALGPEGVAVLNADDPHCATWRTRAAGRQVLDFGLQAAAAVRGTWRPAPTGLYLELETPAGGLGLDLPLAGRHNAANALAATAAALAAGLDLDTVARGLARARAPRGRLEPRPLPGGGLLLDDSYNANPGSLAAGLEVLAAAPGPRWLVLGDMGELGAEGPELHARAGRLARDLGIEALWALGPLAAEAALAFGPGGRAFTDREALLAALAGALAGERPTVLVKGSRAMAMERVAAALAPRHGEVRAC